MPEEEVEYYCFLTKETLEKAREPFYKEGSVADNLNNSLLLVLELSDINPRRREEDRVFLSYCVNKAAIELGYRGDQIDTPEEAESGDIEDEIVDMLDQVVDIEPAEVYGDRRISQVVGAAQRKHQDEIQDIVIVTPEEYRHQVEGELVKQKLTEEIEVKAPGEILELFDEDPECRYEDG